VAELIGIATAIAYTLQSVGYASTMHLVPRIRQDSQGKMVHLCSVLRRRRCLRRILHHDLNHRDRSHHNILLQTQSHRHRDFTKRMRDLSKSCQNVVHYWEKVDISNANN
jgi:hypothetical protein